MPEVDSCRAFHILPILPDAVSFMKRMNKSGDAVPAVLSGKNRIFLENDQTRKTPAADTRAHRQGGLIKEG
ncbi:MAG: hypothetical protein ABFC54_09475, partial [Thermoguttaceae bacterium]